jgi:iron(III) transport system permease protein
MAAEPVHAPRQGDAAPKSVKGRDWVLTLVYLLTFATIAILVLLPLGALILGTLRSAPPNEPGVWTLENYRNLAESGIHKSLVSTLTIAVLTAIASTVGGAVLAWIVCRTDFRYKTLVTVLLSLTFYFPGFIMAMAWAILGINTGVFNILFEFLHIPWRMEIYSQSGIIWIMTLHILPFVFLNLRGPLMSIDSSLEEAAKMSGANAWRTITRITLPLTIFPMLSSFLLVFIMAAEQFAIPALIAIPSSIPMLSTQLYLLVSTPPPQYGLAATFGLILSLITGLSILVQRRIVARTDVTAITGKSYRPTLIPLGPWKWLAYVITFGYLTLALFLPTLVLIYTSLLKFFTLDPTLVQFTLRNYEFIFSSPSTTRTFWNTLYVSAGGAVIGLVLGTLNSYFVHKVKPPGYRVLDFLSSLPFGIPGIVIGLGFLWGYIQTPLYGTVWILLMSYVTRYLPYATEAIGGQMVQLDKSLEEAAWTCGSTRLGGLRRIVLPLLWPSIQSGWFLLFMAFFREISSAVLVYTAQTKMVSIQIFDFFDNAEWNKASALALISTVIVFGMMMFIQHVLPKLRARLGG